MKHVIFLTILLFARAAAQTPCDVDKPTTQGIQAVIDACSAKGGGVVTVPRGEHTIGTIWLKDNVELHVGAGTTLVLSQNPEDYPKQAGPRALIRAKGVKNVALTGAGTIDGRAQYSWGPAKGVDVEITEEIEIARKAGVDMNRWRREGLQAYLVLIEDTENLRVRDICLQNSPIWTLRLQDSNRIWIRGLRLYSSLEKGVNADGVNIVSTSNVFISDAEILTGDDSICLKTTPLNNRPTGLVKPTENIVVTNSVLSSSSTPMMIGTETFGDIHNVTFSNIVVRDSNKVFGINVQDGATVSDVRFTNVTFELKRRHWNWWGSAEVMKFVLKKRTPESRLGRIENITVDGVQGTARGTSLVAGHAERPLKDITISNVRVRMLDEERPDRRMTHGLVFERIDGLRLRNVEVEWAPGVKPPEGQSIVLREVQRLAEGESQSR